MNAGVRYVNICQQQHWIPVHAGCWPSVSRQQPEHWPDQGSRRDTSLAAMAAPSAKEAKPRFPIWRSFQRPCCPNDGWETRAGTPSLPAARAGRGPVARSPCRTAPSPNAAGEKAGGPSFSAVIKEGLCACTPEAVGVPPPRRSQKGHVRDNTGPDEEVLKRRPRSKKREVSGRNWIS